MVPITPYYIHNLKLNYCTYIFLNIFLKTLMNHTIIHIIKNYLFLILTYHFFNKLCTINFKTIYSILINNFTLHIKIPNQHHYYNSIIMILIQLYQLYNYQYCFKLLDLNNSDSRQPSRDTTQVHIGMNNTYYFNN